MTWPVDLTSAHQVRFFYLDGSIAQVNPYNSVIYFYSKIAIMDIHGITYT
jgi:hypothetical protein